ncbi:MULTISPECIES: transporter substrate-binding domain-containing protein [Carnobacterium]|uniref:Amino acid ABC transporter substrate-binding protein, PAAT family n=1 Tax=Carnobacterium alterfunditum TaxID=28230 RepID=A0A1N6FY83_9LACT|nr:MULTISPECIES: transporter substrate-binding domain-containing protein [Carnobacterium]MBT2731985.1 transporter substrate-binding domain-containing protein [Carnobacterium sp. ISL-102]SIO00238.1 amino acid ABC transporter substrate-binding protein, PAAT family [Carnobacterium alterfunditum]
MKKLNKPSLFLLLLLPVFLLAACGSQSAATVDITERIEEKPTLTWGVKVDTNLFGLYDIKSSEIRGFDIDIAKAITEELTGDAANAEFVEVTSKTRIPLLKNGNIDAIIATMTITEERKEQVNFSNVYFDAGQALLVPNDSSIQGLDDVSADTTVLAVKGSTSAKNIRELAPEANVLELENYSEAFTALQSGQGDAVTTDNAILLGIIADNPGYRLAGGIFTQEPYGIAINKGQDAFLNEVNEALDTIKANGVYDEIYADWIPKLD